MSEQDIQRKIKKWLESKGCHVTKYNANGYGVSGHPDLFVSVPMRVYKSLSPTPIAFFVEVKTKTGKLSLAQQIYQGQMERDGHWVIVARCVEDVECFLFQRGMGL